jgi:hypothetical protein
MQQVDPLARTLSIIAILIASGGLWLSLRTYLRAGARVVVTVEKQRKYPAFYVDGYGPFYDDVLTAKVSNKGLAKVQISNMFYEVQGKDGFVTLDPNGPILPFVLEGMHQELWTLSLSTIAKGSDLGANGVSKVRAGVVLGNRAHKFSGWVTLSADEVTKR